MKKSVWRGGMGLLGAAALVANASCAEQVTCGAGTKLDDATSTCIAVGGAPDLNVIVDDFDLGDFSLTEADVPEQMRPGFGEERTFTITNNGSEAQDVTLVRVHLVPVEATIDEAREAIADIGSEPDCESDADCTVSTSCDLEQKLCKLAPINIGGVIIDDLAAGESRQVTYSLALPPEFNTEGVYGLVFTLNEIALIDDPTSDSYIEDPEHPLGLEDPYARAAGIAAPATIIVGVPDKPNLRILSGGIDNNSFTAGNSDTPIATVTNMLSAQGKNVVANVHQRFDLVMPGYEIDVAGQDLGEEFFLESGADFASAPAESTYAYNPERVIQLQIRGDLGDRLSESLLLPECIDDACTEQVTVQNDIGREGAYELFLSPLDERLLAMTATLDADDATNTVLNADGEVLATLRVTASMDEDEFQVNGSALTADNVQEFDVVFLAPEAGRDADVDADGSEVADSEGDQLALPPLRGRYTDFDNFTPTWNWSVGNDWMGAEAQILNNSSKFRQANAVVAQDFVSANYARLNALKQRFDIVNLSATVDFGTRRALAQNFASGRLALFGSTYLDFAFSPNIQCRTEDNFETCLVFEMEARPRKNEGAPTNKAGTKKKIYVNYERSKRQFFAIGPLPFEIEVGVAAGLGMRVNISFVQDRTANDADGTAVTTGLQVTTGPVADASGSAFGGLSVGVLRAGIRGTITFVSLEFQPALLIGLTQEIDDPNNCWKYNHGQIRFEAPLSLKVLFGSIAVVVEGGICGCLPWIGCACAWGTIFSYTIVNLPPAWSNTWQLWSNTWNVTAGSGLCANAPPVPAAQPEVWNSPIGCRTWGGANAYCNYANGTGSYTRTFTKAGCGTLTIAGRTERNYDFVTVRAANGAQLFRASGDFGNNVVNFCDSASVTLTTDYSVVESGITVTKR
jgi:hypothetical protein